MCDKTIYFTININNKHMINIIIEFNINFALFIQCPYAKIQNNYDTIVKDQVNNMLYIT